MHDDRSARSASDKMVVVSLDGHVAPALQEFRPYCEARHLDAFDAYASQVEAGFTKQPGISDEESERSKQYFTAIRDGYGDPALLMDARLRVENLDADGVAAEALYHGAFASDPIPFFNPGLTSGMNQDVPASAELRELRAAGIRIYNRWLADWISIAPERFIGIAHIPAWDVDAAAAEVKWAHEAGLRGVNFPSPRPNLPSFNQLLWDPLWKSCVDNQMALHTHTGVASTTVHDGPGAYGMFLADSHFTTRRGMPQLIFGGVFERFPDLQFFLTEQSGGWLADTLHNLDSAYLFVGQARENPYIRDVLPRLPSDYFRTNIYLGNSFMSRAEAVEAIDNDLWENSMWGRDFPHPEGTWPFTREALRKTFAGFSEHQVRAIVGENALRVMGLDNDKLRAIASEIGPTFEKVNQPLDGRPEGSELSLAFREVGAFA